MNIGIVDNLFCFLGGKSMASPGRNQYITEVEIVYKSDGQQFQSLIENLFGIYIKNISSGNISKTKEVNQ